MKICVIGGGSTYTPELASGFLNLQSELPVDELCLMDIDDSRLNTVFGFIKRYCEKHHAHFRVTKNRNLEEAISGSSYVITQIRVGMIPARREDEYLGDRYGLIGQETTGIGGMCKALRTIPVILDVASTIKKVASTAILINFTNPSGLITEALKTYMPDVNSIGLCNAPYHAKMSILNLYEQLKEEKIDPKRVQLNTLGLNHLSWHRGLMVDGVDVWDQVLPFFIKQLRELENPDWDPDLIENLGMIPNNYLQYYYQTEKMLSLQENWPPSRAEIVLGVEKELLAEYADERNTDLPEGLLQRGGAYYSTVATQLINSHYNNLNEVHVINTLQDGAVQNIPLDWVMEIPCVVNAKGFTPIPTNPLPEAVSGLMTQVKVYEKLTVKAAVSGNEKYLYQAILAHPLGPDAHSIKKIMHDILKTHKKYLPNFFHEL